MPTPTIHGSQLKISHKNPCRAATTGNIADLAAGAPSSVDGIALAAQDRVLVKDQSTASQNGIYRVITVGGGANGVWARTRDFDSSSPDSIQAGLAAYIQEGNTYAEKTFTLTTTGTITVGSTALAFEELGGGAALTQTNAVYFSKAGNDSDTGLTKDAPVLTIGAAITAASGLTPTTSNRVTIFGQDAGIYAESGLTLPDYVSLDAPGATLSGATDLLTLGIESTVNLHRAVQTGGFVAFVCAQAGDCWINADEILSTSTSTIAGGVKVTNASAVCYLDIGLIEMNRGRGIYPTAAGTVIGTVGEFNSTGNGWAIRVDAAIAATINLSAEKIYGPTSTFGLITIGSTAIANLNIGELEAASAIFSVAGTANVFVRELTGTLGSSSGTLNITQAGVFPSAGLTQTNTVYVSKAGSDSNAGTDVLSPKLSITSAMTAASGLSPTTNNRVTVIVQDAGDYNESVTIPDFVSLDAPDAQITPGGSAVIMGLESSINVYKVTSGGTPIDCQGAGQAWVKAGWLQCTGISGTHGGVKASNAAAVVYLDVDYITGSRNGIVNTIAGGKLIGRVGEFAANSFAAIQSNVDGQLDLHVDKLTGATGITLGSTATLNLIIADFSPTAQGVTNNTSIANIVAASASGTAITGAGTSNLLAADDPTPVTQTNVVFVSKAGDDSYDGLSEERPKLTIGSAITAASALTPTTTNRVEIFIQDAGRYTENPTLPDYVSLIGPTASVIQTIAATTITMGLESVVRLAYLTGGNDDALDFAAAGKGWVYISHIEITGISSSPACVHVSDASAEAYIEVGYMTIGSKVGVRVSNTGTVRGRVGTIYGDTSLALGLWMDTAAGQMDLAVDSLLVNGANSDGIRLAISGAVANLTIRNLTCTTSAEQVNIVSGATVNLIASDISGTVGTVLGTYNVTEAGDGALTIDGSGDATRIAIWTDSDTLQSGSFTDNGAGKLAYTSNIEIESAGILTLDAASDVRIQVGGTNWLNLDSSENAVNFTNPGTIDSGGDLTIRLALTTDVLKGFASYDLGSAASPWGDLYLGAGALLHYSSPGNFTIEDDGAIRLTLDSVTGLLTIEDDLVVNNGGTGTVFLGSSSSDNKIFGAATGALTVRSASGEAIEFQPGGSTSYARIMPEGAIILRRNGDPDSGDIGASEGALFTFNTSATAAGEVLGWMDQNGDIQKVSANWMHQGCRAATTANITLANLQTVDGVSLAAGDRVLCKDQSTPGDRGIYIVVDGGSWTRAPDYALNMAYENHGTGNGGAMVYVRDGTANGRQLWVTTGTTLGQVGLTETWELLSDVDAGGMEGSGTVTDTAIPFYDGTSGDVLNDSNFLIDDGLNQLIVPAEGGIYWGAANATPNIDESSGDLIIRGGSGQVQITGATFLVDVPGTLTLDSGTNVVIEVGGVDWATFEGSVRDLALKNVSNVEWIRLDSSAQLIDFSGNGNIDSGATLTLSATTAVILDSAVDVEVQVGTNDSFIIKENSQAVVEVDTSINQLWIKGPTTVNDPYSSVLRLTEDDADYRGAYMQFDGLANQFIIGTHNITDSLTASDVPTIILDRVGGQVGINGLGTTPMTNVLDALHVQNLNSGSVMRVDQQETLSNKACIRAMFTGVTNPSTSSYWMRCEQSGGLIGGVRGDGTSTNVAYIAFAGEHDGQISGSTWTGTAINDGTRDLVKGMVLVTNGTLITDGSIVCEQPQVEVAAAGINNTKVVGVFSGGDDSDVPDDVPVGFDSALPIAHYRALGHGLVLVTDENGDVAKGDLLTTSLSDPGHAQKQSDDIIHSYTIAKAFEDIDWAQTPALPTTANGHKYALVACFVYCG